LQELCRDENARDRTRFTNRVLAAAQIYYKRFYLLTSPMEEEPKFVMLASLYLAGKVEEERIQVEDLLPKYAKQLKRDDLLALELRLLEALRFQMAVRSPFRCLAGLMQDLHAWLEEKRHGQAAAAAEGGATAAQLTAAIDALEGLHQLAIEGVCASLCTDAPFTHSPQQIALAAVLGAGREHPPLRDAGEVEAWVGQRFGSSDGGGVEQLRVLLSQVEATSSMRVDLGAEGMTERLKGIDSKLKRLTKQIKRVEQAQRAERAAAEEACKQERVRAKDGATKEQNELLKRQLAEARASAKAYASAQHAEQVKDEVPDRTGAKKQRIDGGAAAVKSEVKSEVKIEGA